MKRELHLRRGDAAEAPFSLAVSRQRAGWAWTGLRILDLAANESVTLATQDEEMLLVPLSGACAVACEGSHLELRGRRDVFSRVTDFAYLPRDAAAAISSRTGGRFALPSARCSRRLPVRYGRAEDVRVELRGAGACSRQINELAMPGAFDCDKLIVCEVLTPGGNWSSYPPHKHDETWDGESMLEEIYYFEVASGRGGAGLGYQRVYGTQDRPLDLLAEVRTGDVVLVPHGWHGPSMATPGYDLYYLNVMAGPERAWRICDDPRHAWVRAAWRGQAIDPRLPLTTIVERGES